MWYLHAKARSCFTTARVSGAKGCAKESRDRKTNGNETTSRNKLHLPLLLEAEWRASQTGRTFARDSLRAHKGVKDSSIGFVARSAAFEGWGVHASNQQQNKADVRRAVVIKKAALTVHRPAFSIVKPHKSRHPSPGDPIISLFPRTCCWGACCAVAMASARCDSRASSAAWRKTSRCGWSRCRRRKPWRPRRRTTS